MDRDRLDQLVQTVFAKTGTRIRHDDPILLNAAVIQTILENQTAETRELTETVVSENLVKFENSVQSYQAELERVSNSYVANTERFLEAFEETIQDLNNKEVETVEASAARLENRVRLNNTILICCSVLNTLALLAVLWKIL